MRTRRSEQGIVGLVLLIVIAAIALAAFGVYWYFIRDTAPPKASVTVRSTVAPTSGPDGSYHVVAGTSTFAGFRITEQLGPLSHTAVARSPEVTGTMTLAGTTVTPARFTVDLNGLDSKDLDLPPGVPDIAKRVRFLHGSFLEIDRFPTTTFTLTKPIALPSAPKPGVEVHVVATGTLTLHGVTRTVNVPMDAIWNGAVIDVSGSLPVTLADYQIGRPRLPFTTVGGNGTVEFEIELAK
jgi:polyisoprenoid-binding protein YceI